MADQRHQQFLDSQREDQEMATNTMDRRVLSADKIQVGDVSELENNITS